MTIRLDNPNLGGVAPGFGNRHEGGARQERWMQELERAAFGARKAPAPARPQDMAAPAAAVEDPGARAGDAARPSSDGFAGHTARAAADTGAGGQLPVTPGAPKAGLSLSSAFGPMAPIPVAMAAGTGARPGAAGASMPAESVTRLPVLAPARTQLLSHQASARAETEAGADVREPPAANLAEPYAAAHLQLFGNDADNIVQAYIRDAALAHGHAHVVGAAMAAAMAAEGRQLGRLTVNGRAVALPGAVSDAHQSASERAAGPGFDAASANGTAPPLSSTTWYRTGKST